MKEEEFIRKATRVVLSHLSDEKFGVDTLAAELGLSRSKVFNKIKAATGKTVNQFIREIRLTESVKLIETEAHTAAEIAFMVGFSSPQYFSKCFHEYYGTTPGLVKKKHIHDLVPVDRKKNRRLFKTITIATIVVVIAMLVLNFKSISPVFQKDISVSVLPFTDLSEEGDQEWFVTGLTEEIMLGLSKIEGFKVKSSLTPHQFKETHLKFGDLARELEVNYLVCGSYRQEIDTLCITVELIKADGEVAFMTTFNGKNTGVLSIQRDVSDKLVDEISTFLQP